MSAALGVSGLTEPALVRFAPDSYWRGEVHRLVDDHHARALQLATKPSALGLPDYFHERYDPLLADVTTTPRMAATNEDVSEEDWHAQVDLNLKAAFFLNRAAGKIFRERGVGGRIVNFADWLPASGRPRYRGFLPYYVAKAGVVGLTESLALELAPHNIRVNAITPGAVEGDRIDRVIAGQAQVRGLPVEEVRRAFVERVPLNRMVTAEDVAALAVFLSSDLARNISGQCIAVSAGEIV